MPGRTPTSARSSIEVEDAEGRRHREGPGVGPPQLHTGHRVHRVFFAVSEHGSQLTAENRSVRVDGDTLVYRRFGYAETLAPPLRCLQHFRGNLDNWDPALVDHLARGLAP